MCGKDLDATAERFIVKLEVFAAAETTAILEEDLESDHLEEIAELLREESETPTPTPAYQERRYDLCTDCQKTFLANPLKHETQKFDFSPN